MTPVIPAIRADLMSRDTMKSTYLMRRVNIFIACLKRDILLNESLEGFQVWGQHYHFVQEVWIAFHVLCLRHDDPSCIGWECLCEIKHVLRDSKVSDLSFWGGRYYLRIFDRLWWLVSRIFFLHCEIARTIILLLSSRTRLRRLCLRWAADRTCGISRGTGLLLFIRVSRNRRDLGRLICGNMKSVSF